MNSRRLILFTVLAVIVVVLGFFLLDFLVVTEEERVETSLHELARAIEENNVAAVVQHIATGSTELRDEAAKRMDQFVVHSATVKRNLEVVVQPDEEPAVAEARFNGVLVLSDKTGMVSKRTFPRYFILRFQKEDGQWRVTGYEDLDPIKRR